MHVTTSLLRIYIYISEFGRSTENPRMVFAGSGAAFYGFKGLLLCVVGGGPVDMPVKHHGTCPSPERGACA